jgi:hypothetical protein
MQRLRSSLIDPTTGLPPKDAPSKASLEAFFVRHLRTLLVSLFGDEVEFVRESALRLVVMFATLASSTSAPPPAADTTGLAALSALATVCVPALVARVGTSPAPEGTEEVRLLALQLVTFLVERGAVAAVAGSPQGKEVGDGLAAILARSLADQYPEVKRECCVCVRALVKEAPLLASAHGEALLRGLVVNLAHQHSKTRQLTLQALGQLVICCADAAIDTIDSSLGAKVGPGVFADLAAAAEAAGHPMDEGGADVAGAALAGLCGGDSHAAGLRRCLLEVVLPALHRAGCDRSPSVRLTAARLHSFHLRARPERTAAFAALGLEKNALSELLALTGDQVLGGNARVVETVDVARSASPAIVSIVTLALQHRPRSLHLGRV